MNHSYKPFIFTVQQLLYFTKHWKKMIIWKNTCFSNGEITLSNVHSYNVALICYSDTHCLVASHSFQLAFHTGISPQTHQCPWFIVTSQVSRLFLFIPLWVLIHIAMWMQWKNTSVVHCRPIHICVLVWLSQILQWSSVPKAWTGSICHVSKPFTAGGQHLFVGKCQCGRQAERNEKQPTNAYQNSKSKLHSYVHSTK